MYIVHEKEMIQSHRWSGEIHYDADEPSFGEYTNRCVHLCLH